MFYKIDIKFALIRNKRLQKCILDSLIHVQYYVMFIMCRNLYLIKNICLRKVKWFFRKMEKQICNGFQIIKLGDWSQFFRKLQALQLKRRPNIWYCYLYVKILYRVEKYICQFNAWFCGSAGLLQNNSMHRRFIRI